MDLTGLGGGIMLAIAAALWLIYLVPNWLKRREYLATERNAIRLQQTIRVLAEAAEIPDAVRAEQKARTLAKSPVSVGRPVTLPLPEEQDPQALAARRLRRTRVAATLVLAAAVVVAVVQGALLPAGATTGSWLIFAGAGLVALTAFGMLGRLARASRARAPQASRPATSRRVTMSEPLQRSAPQRSAEWTPVPVPKPLYLSRSVAPPRMADLRAAALAQGEMVAASAAAERALRDAQRETEREVTPIVRAVPDLPVEKPAVAPVEAPAAAPSRFARMGIVERPAGSSHDIDAVLARRRAAG